MLISEALAQATAPAQPPVGADFLSLLPLIAIFVVFYLLLIRPQAKRAKEQKLMIEALQKGDEVVTAGGQLGRVVKVSGSYLIVQVAENVQVVLQKNAVQTLLPKGTLSSIEKE
jgi:preprotein translocase subunit YajC